MFIARVVSLARTEGCRERESICGSDLLLLFILHLKKKVPFLIIFVSLHNIAYTFIQYLNDEIGVAFLRNCALFGIGDVHSAQQGIRWF